MRDLVTEVSWNYEINQCFRPLKPESLEPDNTYPVHGAVPSPRSLFPVDLWLKVTHAAATYHYRYNRYEHALMCVSTEHHAQAATHIEVILGADLADIELMYGDYSPLLTALEAGHLYYQLLLVTQALGWQSGSLTLTQADDLANLSGDKALLSFATFTLNTAQDDDLALWLLSHNAPATAVKPVAGGQPFTWLQTYRASLANASQSQRDQLNVCLQGVCGKAAGPDWSLTALAARRTSGFDRYGAISLPEQVPASDIASLLNTFALQANHTLSQARQLGHIDVFVSVVSCKGDARGVWKLSAGAQQFTRISGHSVHHALQQASTTPVQVYHYGDFAFTVQYAVNYGAGLGDHGEYAVPLAHLSIGALAQLMCLKNRKEKICLKLDYQWVVQKKDQSIK